MKDNNLESAIELINNMEEKTEKIAGYQILVRMLIRENEILRNNVELASAIPNSSNMILTEHVEKPDLEPKSMSPPPKIESNPENKSIAEDLIADLEKKEKRLVLPEP